MQPHAQDHACIDALLWVGNASHTYQTIEQFVTEAGLRGCCRRLPFLPGWMKCGKTRVFLAHRGRHKDRRRGSLFGYFVLDRVEIISNNSVSESLRMHGTKSLWPRDVNPYIGCVRKWREEKVPTKRIKVLLRDKLQQEHLPDLARGRGSTRPVLTEDDCLDLIEHVLKELFKEWLNRHGDERFPLNELIAGEGHRGCSLRAGPGAVYAVDALCAAIHDSYRRLMSEHFSTEVKRSGNSERAILNNLKQENANAWDDWMAHKKRHTWDVNDILEAYKGPFHDAVNTHFSATHKQRHPVDPRLRDQSDNRGELIVFHSPFPILERTPQAAFRGILHFDGDVLIDQIARRNNRKDLVAKICFCRPAEDFRGQSEEIRTQAELVTRLAEELKVGKATASGFLHKLSLAAGQQLLCFQKFKLPGIGTLRIRGTGVRRKIKFFPAKDISRASLKEPRRVLLRESR
jgi:hypothetical protein